MIIDVAGISLESLQMRQLRRFLQLSIDAISRSLRFHLTCVFLNISYNSNTVVAGRWLIDNYTKSVQAVQDRLSAKTVVGRRDSLLNSLIFYTRHEELDEYFCSSCNKGDLY